jgi:luciferase family oxidoreductase group 1
VTAQLSVLDLSPIVQGGDAAQSFRNTLDLAQHAERLGYHRFWLAEHHNIPSVASAATAVIIEHVASGTKTIRVGAGGIMLPNHSPLMIAEQFGTLESLHPGRIDLALGRAPGSDQITAQALRRSPQAGDLFPQDVLELMSYFADDPDNAVRAVPGAGLDVPIFILGSSLFGAQLAAHLGVPFAFASHFAPQLLMQAIEIYRSRFKPSRRLEKPYLMLGANVVAANDDKEARLLFTSYEQSFVALRRGHPMPVPPPIEGYEIPLSAIERAQLDPIFSMAIVGGPETVRRRLRDFIATTGADEIIIASQLFDHAARLRSYEIAMTAWQDRT